VRFEEKSPFRSGQEESEQEVIAAAIVLCDAVDVVVGERKYQRLLDSMNSYL